VSFRNQYFVHRCKVGCSSVVGGGEEEDGDEPEEGADSCCQHDANVGSSENSANSSDLENSDDMLQDDEEDLVIDHSMTSMHLATNLGVCCLMLCCRICVTSERKFL